MMRKSSVRTEQAIRAHIHSNVFVLSFIVRLAAILAISCVTAANAADQSTSLSSEIQKSAEEVEQLQLALQSPDASTRYAAFVRAIESERPELIEMAVNVGVSSADQTLQQMAVRAAFVGRTHIAPLALSAEPAEKFQQPAINLIVVTYDWRTGAINLANAQNRRPEFGNITGGGIEYISSAGCTVTMKRKPQSWEFQGTAICDNYNARFHARLSYTMR